MFQLVAANNYVDELARVVVVDRVQLVTHRVKASTPNTADFDSILNDLVAVQHVVSGVAAELERPIQLTILALWIAGAVGIFIGLGPQPIDPELWWQ